MLVHEARVVRADALARLVEAWADARGTGAGRAFDGVLRAEAAARATLAAQVRVRLSDDEAAAIAVAGARAFEAHLHTLLCDPRPVEDLQRLRSAAARFAEVSALPRAPMFLLDAIGASVASLAAGWSAAPAHPEPQGDPTPLDPRWLPEEVVALSGAIGHEPMGLEERFAALDLALDFTRSHPDAGSFWDTHGSGAPDDAIERFPHPVWSRAPTALPHPLAVGGAPARLGVNRGPITLVDAASVARLTPTGVPVVDAWRARVADAVAEGFTVLSWVELRS